MLDDMSRLTTVVACPIALITTTFHVCTKDWNNSLSAGALLLQVHEVWQDALQSQISCHVVQDSDHHIILAWQP